jgi:flagellar hook-associated protein 1 FlgK
MRDEAITQRQSVSGVNLDEEAANLLRYQQAYQAAAQLVRVANEMFRTLLDSTR